MAAGQSSAEIAKNYNQSSMENWRFRNFHMGLDEGGRNTNPITSESVLLAAGPARFKQVADDFVNKVFPIGLVESAMLGQQKMVQQIREIGSRRSYTISSYATGNVTLSRVMYSHASLLRVLTLANDDSVDANGAIDLDNPAGAPPTTTPVFGQSGDALKVADRTAQKTWFVNLQAELFDRPIGLLFYMLDQRNQPYGAMYCEDAMVQTHNLAFAAQGVAVSEQVNLLFDRANPVAVTAS
jgi:hypothetical protein